MEKDVGGWVLSAAEVKARRSAQRAAPYGHSHCGLCGRSKTPSDRDLRCACRVTDVIICRHLAPYSKKWELDGWGAKFREFASVLPTITACSDSIGYSGLVDCALYGGRIEAADAVCSDLIDFIKRVQCDFAGPSADHPFHEMLLRPWQMISSSMTSRSRFLHCMNINRPERVPLECKDSDAVDRYVKLLMTHRGCAEPASQQVCVGELPVFTSLDACWGGYAVEFKTVRYKFGCPKKAMSAKINNKMKSWLAQVACQQLLPADRHPSGNLLVLLLAPSDFLLSEVWRCSCYLQAYIVRPENLTACSALWNQWFSSIPAQDLSDLIAYNAGLISLHDIRGGNAFSVVTPKPTDSTTRVNPNAGKIASNAFDALSCGSDSDSDTSATIVNPGCSDRETVLEDNHAEDWIIV